MFHELIHSTGAKKRLNREIENKFGTKLYALEELTAEMGAAFLCGVAGIDVSSTGIIENTSAYLQDWMEKLSQDDTLIAKAGTKAGKASDHILGLTEQTATVEQTEPEMEMA